MSLEDLGNLGEFVGSIAVLATLIYLAIQIRQNTVATRIQIRQAIADSQFANINSRATDDRLPIIIAKVNANEELNPEEEQRLYFHLDATLRQFENIYYHFNAGVLDEENWVSLRYSLERTLRGEKTRGMWNSMKFAYSEGFREMLDEQLSTSLDA
jgi:hypothetical protein